MSRQLLANLALFQCRLTSVDPTRRSRRLRSTIRARPAALRLAVSLITTRRLTGIPIGAELSPPGQFLFPVYRHLVSTGQANAATSRTMTGC